MRIAIGGIHTECSTYSPVLMNAEDFHVLRGEALFSSDHFAFLQTIEDVECLPLLHARAVPGGPVSRTAYEQFKAEFLDRLKKALPLDGLHLAMHGAMNVEGMDDAEADWVLSARAIVGQNCVVAASYDLHGNISQTIVDQLDIFAAYRTAPHIDVQETMACAFAMLVKALKSGERPGIAWAPIPVLLPGERTSTEDDPARSLYAALPQVDAVPRIWNANLMVGYVWADEPRATAAAVVTATDRNTALKEAEKLAEAYWRERENFRFGAITGTLDEMLEIAAAARTAPVILADSGDNPTGGGVGDRVDVLTALVERDWQGALVAGIADRPAVERCFEAGEGTALSLRIGGSLDPVSPHLTADAVVLRLDDPGEPAERQSVVRIGAIDVVLAARRRPYHRLADFARLSLDPRTARLLVVKSGYLSPELAPLANPNLMALTDGAVNQDIPALANHRRSTPCYPFQDGFAFTPKAHLSRRWA
ncbi:M81 family metallopeptidase [Chelativorans salis]|uniref:Microcystinase C n=1 Tax=Chelativorans salis TaxID=2978478 RepID=A0ABT2LIU7_9HYPH|nr:M81 family metallopeptidase [Chelativorans sp. EGI FJ00035]MCT7374460.1 M81 family metallopeptidase [Chelativorans sp. EGI FJ00035]